MAFEPALLAVLTDAQVNVPQDFPEFFVQSEDTDDDGRGSPGRL